MRLDGIDYGRIWLASGVDGFDGEGYWFHNLWGLVPGFTKDGFTFVSKTLTTYRNLGNMPLDQYWTPIEWLPKCIWWDFWQGIGLNAIGLSNFGVAEQPFDFWTTRTAPFMISWMPVTSDPVAEAERFVEVMVGQILPDIFAPVALQANFTCPSTGQDLSVLIKKVVSVLKVLENLGIPVVMKLNILTDPEDVANIASQAKVDGLIMSNTIPFGTEGLGIDWQKLTGEVSPLTKRGIPQPGGLSGSLLYPLVKKWVLRADKFINLPINFCGGVDSPEKVSEALKLPNVESVSVATAFVTRPWRLRDMVKAANQ